MKLFHTIRGRMILCYTVIILVIVCSFSALYYTYTASLLEKRASESLQQLSINNNANLDALIGNMDATANRINSSALIKEAFYADANTQLGLLENKRHMMQLLFTVTGSKIVNQINLIGTDGKFVEFGRTFDISYRSTEALTRVPWIEECRALEGKMHLAAPHVYEWNTSGNVVVSVCRAFNESFGTDYDGVVEILLDYDVFAQTIEAALRPNHVRAFVYDAGGRQIYPLEGNASAYYQETLARPSGTFPLTTEGRREIVSYDRSSYTGVTMVMCEDENRLLAPVADFRNRLVFFGVLIMLVTTFITSLLARQLTEPIRSIQRSISALDLGALHSETADTYKHSAYELTTLGSAYTEMVERLQASLGETLTAHSREVEARMLALQAQMNPHFLYNTITIISIKAEDNGDEDVVQMCQALSSMLRYIAKDAPAFVPLREELAHLHQYLYLMACRFPAQFEATVDLAEEMMALPIPKLILQPLVENCFKHGFHKRSPWSVRVKGTCDGRAWRVTVTDNGVGFSDEALAQMEKIFSETSGDFRATEGDNIGLGNIFHRLKYCYKDKATFSIQNLPQGGCEITVGGTWEATDSHGI